MRVAAFIPDKWFKEKKAELKAVLDRPIKGRPDDWGFVFRDQLEGFFDRFQREFSDQMALKKAMDSVIGRVDSAKNYLDALVVKINKAGLVGRPVNFSDPKSYLTWYAATEIHEKMASQAKTFRDLYRWSWSIDEGVLEKLVQRTLKVGTPAEIESLTDDTHYRAKYDFLDRVDFKAKALKALKREKLEWDPTKWVDRIYEMLKANYQEWHLQDENELEQFDVNGIKVIVDDKTVTGKDVEKYVAYFKEAHSALQSKGFGKAWYGNVFIQCVECGGKNQNTGGGTGGWFEIQPDTVTVFVRPSPFVVELMVHELGHRYWFKSMSGSQRARFADLVKVHTKPRPSNPTNVQMFRDSDLRSFKKRIEDTGKDIGQVVYRAEKIDLKRSLPSVLDGVSKGLWHKGLDLTDIISELNLDKEVYDDPSVGSARDATYNAKREFVGRGAELSLQNPDTMREWLTDVLNLGSAATTAAQNYLDLAVKKQNAYADAKLENDPRTKEWLDSYERNQAPVLPVSSYGKSNIDEAFAEVFTHYVLEFPPMTRDQLESFKSVIKTASSVRVLLEGPEVAQVRAKYPAHPDGVLGTFASPITLYRIFDGEEMARILASGKVTGGNYSVKAEREHGASWGADPSDLVRWGNSVRGKRLGEDLFLAKLNAQGKKFYHLNPEIPDVDTSAERQEVTMSPGRINLGLGASVLDVKLSDVDLFSVGKDSRLEKVTVQEAKSLVESKPKKDVDLREVSPTFYQGQMYGVDVRVTVRGGIWGAYTSDDRQIASNGKTKEDAIEMAQKAIRLNPRRPVPVDMSILEQERKYKKHFQPDDDPEKTRGNYGLKSKDKVLVLKGSTPLGIKIREKLTVADVYQVKGDPRTVFVKLMQGSKPMTLRAIHPNRLNDLEIPLLGISNQKILVSKTS